MFKSIYWKYGAAVGAGVAIGAVAAVLLSKNSVDLKKAFTAALSHGMDLKDKASELAETAKENVDDLVVEAKEAQEARKAGVAKS